MELERIRKDGRILIRPKDKYDRPLFMHCANGMEAVTTRYYNSDVEKLLFIHKVGHISMDDKT